MPGFNYDLSHPGRDKSHGWFFFSTYNTEEASTLLEVNASQNDKDFIAAVNWKMIEEYVNNGGGTTMQTKYAHNACRKLQQPHGDNQTQTKLCYVPLNAVIDQTLHFG